RTAGITLVAHGVYRDQPEHAPDAIPILEQGVGIDVANHDLVDLAIDGAADEQRVVRLYRARRPDPGKPDAVGQRGLCEVEVGGRKAVIEAAGHRRLFGHELDAVGLQRPARAYGDVSGDQDLGVGRRDDAGADPAEQLGLVFVDDRRRDQAETPADGCA